MSVLASAVSSSLSVIELQPARNDRDKTSQFRKGTFYELVSPVFFNRFWFLVRVCMPPRWSLFGGASLLGRHHSAPRRSELMRNDTVHGAAVQTPAMPRYPVRRARATDGSSARFVGGWPAGDRRPVG